jgi:hypothetical protein
VKGAWEELYSTLGVHLYPLLSLAAGAGNDLSAQTLSRSLRCQEQTGVKGAWEELYSTLSANDHRLAHAAAAWRK